MSDVESARKSALIAYILYLVGLFLPLASIVAVVVNHIKQKETEDTWVGSHHRWMKRTFWFSVLWGLLGGIFAIIPGIGIVAIPILLGLMIWYIYRIARGGLRFLDNKPMYAD